MIIELKIANYRSINATQTLSFVAEKAPRHPDNLIPCRGFKLLKAVALFGANASGKSNLVKAIGGMSQYVRDSATRMNDGDRIPVAEPFRLSSETVNAPSRFEVTFLMEGMVYVYGFSATAERVHAEWLKAHSETARTETLWFERHLDAATGQYTWAFAGPLKSVEVLLRERTRSNALVLSTGAQLNVEPLLPLYRYFHRQILRLDVPGVDINPLRDATKLYKTDPNLSGHIVQLMHSADIDIETLDIEDEDTDTSPSEDHQANVKPLPVAPLNRLVLLSKNLRDMLTVPHITAYRKRDDGTLEPFDFATEESSGTQRLFIIAGPLFNALETGAFLVIDELDASMHPLLTRRLLELFQNPHANTKGAQLLFTTHDPALFDQELFRRDQIWLAERRNSASEFFSLTDIEPSPRNTEAFLRNYLAGRYGGAPQFVTCFEDRKLSTAK